MASPFFADLQSGISGQKSTSEDCLSNGLHFPATKSLNDVSELLPSTEFFQKSYSFDSMEDCNSQNEGLEAASRSDIPKFIVESKIGEGSYGKVFKVLSPIDRREYALKIIEVYPEEVTSSLHEAECLSRISSPRVVKYVNFWSVPSEVIPYGISLHIQMELVKGGSLANFISARKPFELKYGIHLFHEMTLALFDIHSAGVVHRDFAPFNILLTPEGSIVVIDFGISCINYDAPAPVPRAESAPYPPPLLLGSQPYHDQRENSEDCTQRETGTPFYASPQQLRGRPSEASDDIYSLGIIVFELFSQFKTAMEKAKAVKDLRSLGYLPDSFRQKYPIISDLIKSMTSPEPSSRPSAVDILRSQVFGGG